MVLVELCLNNFRWACHSSRAVSRTRGGRREIRTRRCRGIDELLALAEQTDQRWTDSFLHRIRGESF